MLFQRWGKTTEYWTGWNIVIVNNTVRGGVVETNAMIKISKGASIHEFQNLNKKSDPLEIYLEY